MQRAFKYRIYPNKTQEDELYAILNQGRLLWNVGLDVIFTAYRLTAQNEAPIRERDFFRSGGRYPYKRRLGDFLRWMARRYPKFNRLEPNDNIQYMLDDMKLAFDKWMDLRTKEKFGKGRPKFKRFDMAASLTYRTGFLLIDPETGKSYGIGKHGSAVRCPAFTEFDTPIKGQYLMIRGWGKYRFPDPYMRIHMNRPLPAHSEEHPTDIKTVQLVNDRGAWYIVITVEWKNGFPSMQPIDRGLGVDVGLKYLVAHSDDTLPSEDDEPHSVGVKSIRHKQWYHKGLPEFRRLSKAASRRLRKANPDYFDAKGRIKRGPKEWVFTNNYLRASEERDRLHRRVSEQRKSFWEQYVDWVTHPDKGGYSFVAIEDMNATWMNGKKAMARLSADAALGMFRLKLEHKCQERGVMLIRVEPAYTSQTCRCCGHRVKENREERDWFRCVACGHEEDADIHAAKNILTRGYEYVGIIKAYFVANPDQLEAVLEKAAGKVRWYRKVCMPIADELKVRDWRNVARVAEWMSGG